MLAPGLIIEKCIASQSRCWLVSNIIPVWVRDLKPRGKMADFSSDSEHSDHDNPDDDTFTVPKKRGRKLADTFDSSEGEDNEQTEPRKKKQRHGKKNQ